jgi:hypothetical protein
MGIPNLSYAVSIGTYPGILSIGYIFSGWIKTENRRKSVLKQNDGHLARDGGVGRSVP